MAGTSPRWALWDHEAKAWDEVPTENAPGEWLGRHAYGNEDDLGRAVSRLLKTSYWSGFHRGQVLGAVCGIVGSVIGIVIGKAVGL